MINKIGLLMEIVKYYKINKYFARKVLDAFYNELISYEVASDLLVNYDKDKEAANLAIELYNSCNKIFITLNFFEIIRFLKKFGHPKAKEIIASNDIKEILLLIKIHTVGIDNPNEFYKINPNAMSFITREKRVTIDNFFKQDVYATEFLLDKDKPLINRSLAFTLLDNKNIYFKNKYVKLLLDAASEKGYIFATLMSRLLANKGIRQNELIMKFIINEADAEVLDKALEILRRNRILKDEEHLYILSELKDKDDKMLYLNHLNTLYPYENEEKNKELTDLFEKYLKADLSFDAFYNILHDPMYSESKLVRNK
ncbi:MAG: hypothetical protein E7163_00525 [Firmicutes bacterium]|nr:hypothetical protein [Bacillota bacterium]